MAKKRKTKQAKIIARLRRQVAISQPPPLSFPTFSSPSTKTVTTTLSSNPALLKKDLLKTLGLSLFILVLEIVLYSRLK